MNDSYKSHLNNLTISDPLQESEIDQIRKSIVSSGKNSNKEVRISDAGNELP